MFLENDFILEISRGKVPGMSSVNKFGRNPDVDGAEDIWVNGGFWVPPTLARTHDIASTSTQDKGSLLSTGTFTSRSRNEVNDNDATFLSDGVSAGDTILDDDNMEHSHVLTVESETKITCLPTRHNKWFETGHTYRIVTAIGTGASVLHWQGINQLFEEAEEFLIPDGTTSVATANEYWRIFRGHLDGAASRENSNIGPITATAQVDSTITAKIDIGQGQTLMAIYTVPRGKRAYMVNVWGSLNRAGGSGTFADLSIREFPFAMYGYSGNRTRHFGSIAADGSNTFDKPFKPFKMFEAESDIILRVESVSAGNADISGGYDLILVDH